MPEGYPTLQSWILVPWVSLWRVNAEAPFLGQCYPMTWPPIFSPISWTWPISLTLCLGRTQQTIHYFQVGPVDPSQITQQKLRMGVDPEHAFIPNWAARCTVKFGDSKWWKMMEHDTRRVYHAICTQFKIFSHFGAVASNWSPPVLPGFHLWHPLFTTALRGNILPQGTLASDTARIFKTSAIRHQSSIRNQ